MISVHCIGGQTASGKTAYALNLAKKTGGHIISFDSRQVYIGATIVTGKDVGDAPFTIWKQMSIDGIECTIGYYLIDGVKLWLSDIIAPNVSFTSFHYDAVFNVLFTHLYDEGVQDYYLVGASYFYLRHVLYGFQTLSIPIDTVLRSEFQKKTIEELQTILLQYDNNALQTMNNSDKNNPYRLIRYIEILKYSGYRKPSENIPKLHEKLGIFRDDIAYSYTLFAHMDRAMQEKRILQRIHDRWEPSIKEMRVLMSQGYVAQDPGLKHSGYPLIGDFIHKKLTKEETISLWLQKEMREAKKQKTAFMANEEFRTNIVLI